MNKMKIACVMVAICLVSASGVFSGKTGRLGAAGCDMNEPDGEATMKVEQSESDTDFLVRHHLSELKRMDQNDQDQYVNSLQVLKKMEALGLEEEDCLYPERKMSDIAKQVDALNGRYDAEERITFEGTSAAELQQTINDNPNVVIDIVADQIQLYDTIVLRNNTIINGNGVKFSADGLKYGFIGEGASDIYINGVFIEGDLEYGIYFAECHNIYVGNCQINGCAQKAVCIVGDSEGFQICNNKLSNNMAGAIYLAGEVSNGIIEDNTIKNSHGTSNLMAGIAFTSDNPQNKRDIWDNFIDETHRDPYRGKQYEQTKAPHDIIIRNNYVGESDSSGIYSDGAYCCYVIGNRISRNDKEGICLDNGSIGFYLRKNVFEWNGRRIRQTDEDLRLDYILELGKMEDGSSKSKLPGVSLDNAAYNMLENNIVINNYGGGIKMVRTTVRTVIIENIIKDNNIGQNDSFHFFGIEIGAASLGTQSGIFDYAPGYENIICRNSITGNHYAGVYIGEDCYVNDIFDNIIMDAKMFAVEAVSKKLNTIENNISNCGIRNEYQE